MNTNLFYVWGFSRIAMDYIPLAVYHIKKDAETKLQFLKDEHEIESGAVLELTWDSFCKMSVSVRLKELAAPVEALVQCLKHQAAIIVKKEDGKTITLYGGSAFPVAETKP